MEKSMMDRANEGKMFRIKQYRVWIGLLARRLWRQPVYVGLLLLVPLLGYVAGSMEREERSGAAVAVCVEEGVWKEEILTMLQGQEENSVLRFVYLEEGSEVERMAAAGEVECGFVIPSDIAKKVLDGAWEESITAFAMDTGSVIGIAKERIAGVIFRLYANACYEEYMGQFSEEAAVFAREAYENRLVDDSTFGFQYFYDDSIGQISSDTSAGDDSNDKSGDKSVRRETVQNAGKQDDIPVFPVKGIFGILIFLGGLCGLLEYERDRKEKRFIRLAPDILTCLINIWVSTVFVSAAVLLSQWLYDGIHYYGTALTASRMAAVWSGAMWGRQIFALLIYQCVILLYCVILKVLLRRQETIAAAIPILTLGSLLCAPVFVRLGTYMPVFTVLEKLFPVTYYLML